MISLWLLGLLPLALAFGIFGNDDDDDSSDHDSDNETGAGEEITLTPDLREVEGTSGDDTITGTDEADTVNGGAGEDLIFLGEGHDNGITGTTFEAADDAISRLFGGDAAGMQDDLVALGIYGGQGGTGEDYIDGGHGNDAITGNEGNDTLRGNLGADWLIDTRGADSMHGGWGDDLLIAVDETDSNHADHLDGSAGEDELVGDDGDTMTGGADADGFAIFWQPGDDPVTITDFGLINENLTTPSQEYLDIYVPSIPEGASFELVEDSAGSLVQLGGETLAVIEGLSPADLVSRPVFLYDIDAGEWYQPELPEGLAQPILGTNENDVLDGTDGTDTIYGWLGADDIMAMDGDDVIYGGYGADTISDGAGNDTIDGGAQNDLINNGAGNDEIHAGDGNDHVRDGDGDDVIDLGAGDDIVTDVAPAESTASDDDLILGFDGNDTILGSYGADSFIGGEGDDLLSLSLEADGGLLDGGNGNDLLFTDGGAHQLVGGEGNDTIVASDLNATASAGASLADTIDGGAGDDSIVADLRDVVTLGAGADHLTGGIDLGMTDLGAGVIEVTDFDPAADTLAIDYIATTGTGTPAIGLSTNAAGTGTLVSLDGHAVFNLIGVAPAQVDSASIVLTQTAAA